MIRAIVQLLQLLVRLAELDSLSKSDPDSTVTHSNGFSITNHDNDQLAARRDFHPLGLEAPVQVGKTEVSTTLPKKRGRPPKVNRAEELPNS